ncbi:hypothetical protein GW17_00012337 [Ensete ventricosum]|nr:hypothetical protein GW17_00012337 [Ensete ventricosum]RZS22755.1 hypothetical protein BHM03_00055578 [Ensete ventricosum]
MYASSPAIVSVRSWSSVRWMKPRGPVRKVDCRNGGARVGLKGVDLTYVRSVVRPLTPPYLRQTGFPMSGRPRRRASCPRARGRGGQVNICHIILPPPGKTFSRCPIRVMKMRSYAKPPVCGDVRLVPKAS